jgi:hypothetical protein
MNFFFGINNNIFKSEIQIPLFQNKYLGSSKFCLYRCYPRNREWIIEKINIKRTNKYFYILKNENINNNEIYFLASEKILKNYNRLKLENLNNFTDTIPAFRANLKIYIEDGGFSSFQSEYPYSMVSKKGSILSSISSLTNLNANNNYIIFKNIFENPIEEKFNGFLVNYKTKKIEEKYELYTNYSNIIELNKNLIKPEIFFTSKNYLGIPIFISENNKFLSFEHTHPPHSYILSRNRYEKIKILKEKINEIIN